MMGATHAPATRGRFLSRLALIMLAAVCLVPLAGASAGPAVAADGPLPADPNIVVFYIDDVSPHDGRLWNDPGRTPAVYDRFIANGIDFERAIVESPLCCPGRGNLLTGLHTHNNRVITNDALLFDPAVHIGKSLKDAGYASMFIGKYLNRNDDLTPEQWAAHDAGWTQLDVIKGVNGDFWGYDLHTKTGEFRVNGLHSTQMVGDRTVMHLRETPAEQPVFAVLSIYNMHGPNRPMPQDVGDQRCASMPPWNPGNYNEADVSDKPTQIQALPLQPYPDGWPMVGYCEEALGIDRVVGQVVDELEAQGRLDNTLLVFTADNGVAWGAHRLGQQKIWPYTTPVPLYMSWPDAGWGTPARTNDEIVSNIDLAPTFCALASGCALDGYARGITGPDGVNLVPLIEGDEVNLGRDAVLEVMYSPGSRTWAGLRTTVRYSANHRWHYVEYLNGELELYDLATDPDELTNLATKPGLAGVRSDLHDMLSELRVEGITAGAGTIRLIQDTLPDSGDDFEFSGDLGDFTLDDDADPTHPREIAFSVASGAYSIQRPPVNPWTLDSVDCNGVGVVYPLDDELLLYLHPDEELVCTFTDVQRQPDASIAKQQDGEYKLDNYYSGTATKKQTWRRSHVRVGRTYDYWVRLQNDSSTPDYLSVTGVATGPATIAVAYLANNVDVTTAVESGTHSIYTSPGGVGLLRIRLTVGVGTAKGVPKKVVITVRSSSNPGRVDVVRAVAVR
jgi:N-acetylglucosamine-6-sulfatase